MEKTHITVVVCSYNRADMLRETLDSLMAVECDERFDFDVVVVDNASTDQTPDVVEDSIARSLIPMRGVVEQQGGVSFARNRGIAEATGDCIAFFDDDQLADPSWLKELMNLAVEKSTRCVGGAIRLQFEDGKPRELAKSVRSLLGEHSETRRCYKFHRKASPGCGNLMIHRSVFDAIGRFDETLAEAGEDADLFRRMQAADIDAWHTPQAIGYHVIPAYRLEEQYIRWKSLRNGGHLARRNLSEWNRLAFVFVLCARLGQAALVFAPRLLWARLRGDTGEIVGTRCLLWRTEGYTRFALHFLAPSLFVQRRFFEDMEFRNERETLASTEVVGCQAAAR